MDITDVRVRLVEGSSQKVRAFCTITIDDAFVVKDIKVIEGDNGEFIAMPSRKLSEKCGKCDRKNPIGSSFCSSCGGRVPESKKEPRDGSLYSDIAHPINAECRHMIQDTIIAAYRESREDSVPVAELADEPADVPVAELADEPADVPVAELADEPADVPVAELADEPEPVQEDEPEEDDGQCSFGEGII